MPRRNLMRGYLDHRAEMNYIKNDYNQSGPTRKDRLNREKSRWSEELYEGMLDWKEKHGSRKMPTRK